ncbi:major facilitator superfamily transporter [Diaporthe eres]|nr:major facilitator superfamily transporter [Diaporthe eres]
MTSSSTHVAGQENLSPLKLQVPESPSPFDETGNISISTHGCYFLDLYYHDYISQRPTALRFNFPGPIGVTKFRRLRSVGIHTETWCDSSIGPRESQEISPWGRTQPSRPEAEPIIPHLTLYLFAMAALHRDEKSDQARQTAYLEESNAENGPQENDNDFADDPKRETVESVTSYTKEEEGEALKRLDWNLIPLLGVLYLVSYIDRGNVGNAYTAGMGKEWGITSDDYSWIVTILYIGYILFHWAVTTNFAGIMALRFLVGALEAGFVPAVALYMTFFYHRAEMGLRYGLFISFSPLASCFASALAYGLVHTKTSVHNWKLLSLVEGAPTILLAVVSYFYLPPSPSECRFLTPRQNEIISQRAFRGRGEKREGKLNFKQAFAAFGDYKDYLQAMIIFCVSSSSFILSPCVSMLPLNSETICAHSESFFASSSTYECLADGIVILLRWPFKLLFKIFVWGCFFDRYWDSKLIA